MQLKALKSQFLNDEGTKLKQGDNLCWVLWRKTFVKKKTTKKSAEKLL